MTMEETVYYIQPFTILHEVIYKSDCVLTSIAKLLYKYPSYQILLFRRFVETWSTMSQKKSHAVP